MLQSMLRNQQFHTLPAEQNLIKASGMYVISRASKVLNVYITGLAIRYLNCNLLK